MAIIERETTRTINYADEDRRKRHEEVRESAACRMNKKG